MKADRGVQLYSIFNIGSRWERVVLSPGRLATGQRKDNHCIGNWIVSRAGLDGTERLKHNGFRSSDHPVCSESLYRLPIHFSLQFRNFIWCFSMSVLELIIVDCFSINVGLRVVFIWKHDDVVVVVVASCCCFLGNEKENMHPAFILANSAIF